MYSFALRYALSSTYPLLRLGVPGALFRHGAAEVWSYVFLPVFVIELLRQSLVSISRYNYLFLLFVSCPPSVFAVRDLLNIPPIFTFTPHVKSICQAITFVHMSTVWRQVAARVWSASLSLRHAVTFPRKHSTETIMYRNIGRQRQKYDRFKVSRVLIRWLL